MKEYQRLSLARSMGLQIPRGVHIPKRCKKKVFGAPRSHSGEIFREPASHKKSRIVEGHVMPDHIHMCISIPPKCAVSDVVGCIKGKSAIIVARMFGGTAWNFTGGNFWPRGYFVSTVGLDEATIRAYIRNQE